MRVLGYQDNTKIYQIALQILTLSLVDEKLLNYRCSQIAASALILAVNIYMVQKELKEGTSPFSTTSFFYIKPSERYKFNNTADKRILNTSIWNNSEVS